MVRIALDVVIANYGTRQGKGFWIYIAESALTYLILAVTAYPLERRSGVIFVQDWQFYAITVSPPTVSSFPGCVPLSFMTSALHDD
ncbi:uncharacterized protein DUF2818 [Paraburkholderia sp. BL8N3]|nr:uncharacterized protein DUF2818 [Paraburkholderia sp. BL8N3]